jgi:hypothetical protein
VSVLLLLQHISLSGGEKACGGEVDAPFGGSGTSTMTLKAALIKWRLFVTWQKLELG